MNTLKRIGTLSSICLLIAASTTALGAGAPAKVGAHAPSFELLDQNGDRRKLHDYRGNWLTIYFYPKDDTPGCTTEACEFRDNIFAFRKIGAKIVGISVDDAESHKAFAEKYSLPFSLLADPGGETAKAYGVLSDRSYAKRETFLVDPDGRIVKHYKQVTPDSHSQEVLSDLKALQAKITL